MNKKASYMILLAACGWVMSAPAQTVVEKPTVQQPTAFAIVTDNETYRQTHESMLRYRDAVQQDGLATYIIRGDWNTPDEVKREIVGVYKACPTLEGFVLVGDIPVAMVRNAQHLTTAFKMNEETFSFPESSVPSDRFYDDLHLQFEYLRQDSVEKHLFYYKLSEQGPQTLSPTFYSARVRYPEGRGGDKYAAIRAFFEKAVRAKQLSAHNPLDRVVSYNGAAYNSDCLIAWMDEEKAYRENFPLAFRTGSGFKHWNFRMEPFMKYRLFDELQRTETDLFMFHEHGTPMGQLISNPEEGSSFDSRYRLMKSELYSEMQGLLKQGAGEDSLKHAYAERYGLTPRFFAQLHDSLFWRDDSIRQADTYIVAEELDTRYSNPLFVMFDACYNGSFHEADYLAGHYLFNGGQTVTVQGNTRNVLQDRWTIEMLGLLSHGVRVGQYNRFIASLEGHLLGDPTLRFAPIESNTLSADITLHKRDTAYWRKMLSSPYADVQCLSLRMLADNDASETLSAKLLDIFRTTPFNTVRMETLKLLLRYNNQDFLQAVEAGLTDSYELVARQSAWYAGKVGNPVLLPAMVRALVDFNERQRVQYALINALQLFPPRDFVQAVESYYQHNDRLHAEREKKGILEGIEGRFTMFERNDRNLSDSLATPTKRINAIRLLRNNPLHSHIALYLDVLNDADAPQEVRIAMAEALGWFNYSVARAGILAACRQLLKQNGLPEPLADELRQTVARLSSAYSLGN